MGNHRSAASGAGDDKMPVFKGARQLLECLERLARRPRRREAPASAGKTRGVQGIPLVCLKRVDDGGALVEGLARYLKEAEPRRIPHVVHRCVPPPPGADDLDDMAGGLLRIARELASGPNTAGGRIRFGRFGLVHWLIHQDLGADHIDSDGLLRRRLRDRELSSSRYASLFSDELPEFLDAPVARWAKLARIVPPLWFMVRLSGRVPGIGREYRWLLRQPYLEPQDPGTVLGFGVRLTEGRRDAEEPEEVLLLLVKAFLSDLAHAYRRSFWHPRGARRTSYPVVLLDDAEEGGFLLQHLVQEIRSHPRRTFDPLVLVAAARTFPPDALSGGGTGSGVVRWTASEAVDGYEAWCRRGAGRSRAEDVWHLLIRVPPVEVKPAADADDEQYAALWHAANNARRFEVATPALWARAWVVPVALVLLMVGGAGGWFATGRPAAPDIHLSLPRLSASDREEPADGPPVPANTDDVQLEEAGLPYCSKDAAAHRNVRLVLQSAERYECVGVAGQMAAFAPRDRSAAQFDATLSAQNDRAGELKRASPDRPVLCLVYATAFESRGKGGKTPDNTEQKLEFMGYLRAQQRQNTMRDGPNQPIVRLLLGNAGPGMGNYPAMLAQFGPAGDGCDALGVIGLDESTSTTRQLILKLNDLQYPVVSATLTADNLADGARNYFSVAAPNSAQAAEIARWAADRTDGRQVPRDVAVICPRDAGNLWSETLTHFLRRQFAGRRWNLTVYAYTPDLLEAEEDTGGGACGSSAVPVDELEDLPAQLREQGDPVVVFAGRGQDFGVFLTHFDSDLDVIAADDVSSDVARRQDNGSLDGREYSYISLAFAGEGESPAKQEYAGYLRFKGMNDIRADVDGHAALAEAAALAYIRAARAVRADGLALGRERLIEKLRLQAGDRAGSPDTGQLEPKVWSGVDCRVCVLRVTKNMRIRPDQ
ncbi:hypothetical protein GCM10022223_07160 [Kineosporia mesophila]|uniref:ABC-type branched-subunit amino acid transport system substrate-binding protein n=1 Tax=Kineosporia mesophila TaxID=566012 RepID=A0ABP6Z213_9ACTN|nr:hypothetical protein [Kineosporia mesophila]MCD5351095.1 hypothetical protein [Kineosporia mesophila]